MTKKLNMNNYGFIKLYLSFLLLFCSFSGISNASIKLTYPKAFNSLFHSLTDERVRKADERKLITSAPTLNPEQLAFLNEYITIIRCGHSVSARDTTTYLPIDIALNVSWEMTNFIKHGIQLEMWNYNHPGIVNTLTPLTSKRNLGDLNTVSVATDATLYEIEIPQPVSITALKSCRPFCVLRLSTSFGNGNIVSHSCARVQLVEDERQINCSGRGVFASNTKECACDWLYSGKYCQYKDECFESVDCARQNAGRCIDMLKTNSQLSSSIPIHAMHPRALCFCQDGWFGPGCEKKSVAKSINPNNMATVKLSPLVQLYWKISKENGEIEIILVAETTSWVFFGWSQNQNEALNSARNQPSETAVGPLRTSNRVCATNPFDDYLYEGRERTDYTCLDGILACAKTENLNRIVDVVLPLAKVQNPLFKDEIHNLVEDFNFDLRGRNGEDNILDASTHEENGLTFVYFKKRFKNLDDIDVEFNNSTMKVMWAIGRSPRSITSFMEIPDVFALRDRSHMHSGTGTVDFINGYDRFLQSQLTDNLDSIQRSISNQTEGSENEIANNQNNQPIRVNIETSAVLQQSNNNNINGNTNDSLNKKEKNPQNSNTKLLCDEILAYQPENCETLDNCEYKISIKRDRKSRSHGRYMVTYEITKYMDFNDIQMSRELGDFSGLMLSKNLDRKSTDVILGWKDRTGGPIISDMFTANFGSTLYVDSRQDIFRASLRKFSSSPSNTTTNVNSTKISRSSNPTRSELLNQRRIENGVPIRNQHTVENPKLRMVLSFQRMTQGANSEKTTSPQQPHNNILENQDLFFSSGQDASHNPDVDCFYFFVPSYQKSFEAIDFMRNFNSRKNFSETERENFYPYMQPILMRPICMEFCPEEYYYDTRERSNGQSPINGNIVRRPQTISNTHEGENGSLSFQNRPQTSNSNPNLAVYDERGSQRALPNQPTIYDFPRRHIQGLDPQSLHIVQLGERERGPALRYASNDHRIPNNNQQFPSLQSSVNFADSEQERENGNERQNQNQNLPTTRRNGIVSENGVIFVDTETLLRPFNNATNVITDMRLLQSTLGENGNNNNNNTLLGNNSSAPQQNPSRSFIDPIIGGGPPTENRRNVLVFDLPNINENNNADNLKDHLNSQNGEILERSNLTRNLNSNQSTVSLNNETAERKNTYTRYIVQVHGDEYVKETSKTQFCLFTPDPGPCFQYSTKWFFDVNSLTCIQFAYGNCRGSLNRFDSELECQTVCRPVVERIKYRRKLELQRQRERTEGRPLNNNEKVEGRFQSDILLETTKTPVELNSRNQNRNGAIKLSQKPSSPPSSLNSRENKITGNNNDNGLEINTPYTRQSASPNVRPTNNNLIKRPENRNINGEGAGGQRTQNIVAEKSSELRPRTNAKTTQQTPERPESFNIQTRQKLVSPTTYNNGLNTDNRNNVQREPLIPPTINKEERDRNTERIGNIIPKNEIIHQDTRRQNSETTIVNVRPIPETIQQKQSIKTVPPPIKRENLNRNQNEPNKKVVEKSPSPVINEPQEVEESLIVVTPTSVDDDDINDNFFNNRETESQNQPQKNSSTFTTQNIGGQRLNSLANSQSDIKNNDGIVNHKITVIKPTENTERIVSTRFQAISSQTELKPSTTSSTTDFDSQNSSTRLTKQWYQAKTDVEIENTQSPQIVTSSTLNIITKNNPAFDRHNAENTARSDDKITERIVNTAKGQNLGVLGSGGFDRNKTSETESSNEEKSDPFAKTLDLTDAKLYFLLKFAMRKTVWDPKLSDRKSHPFRLMEWRIKNIILDERTFRYFPLFNKFTNMSFSPGSIVGQIELEFLIPAPQEDIQNNSSSSSTPRQNGKNALIQRELQLKELETILPSALKNFILDNFPDSFSYYDTAAGNLTTITIKPSVSNSTSAPDNGIDYSIDVNSLEILAQPRQSNVELSDQILSAAFDNPETTTTNLSIRTSERTTPPKPSQTTAFKTFIKPKITTSQYDDSKSTVAKLTDTTTKAIPTKPYKISSTTAFTETSSVLNEEKTTTQYILAERTVSSESLNTPLSTPPRTRGVTYEHTEPTIKTSQTYLTHSTTLRPIIRSTPSTTQIQEFNSITTNARYDEINTKKQQKASTIKYQTPWVKIIDVTNKETADLYHEKRTTTPIETTPSPKENTEESVETSSYSLYSLEDLERYRPVQQTSKLPNNENGKEFDKPESINTIPIGYHQQPIRNINTPANIFKTDDTSSYVLQTNDNLANEENVKENNIRYIVSTKSTDQQGYLTQEIDRQHHNKTSDASSFVNYFEARDKPIRNDNVVYSINSVTQHPQTPNENSNSNLGNIIYDPTGITVGFLDSIKQVSKGKEHETSRLHAASNAETRTRAIIVASCAVFALFLTFAAIFLRRAYLKRKKELRNGKISKIGGRASKDDSTSSEYTGNKNGLVHPYAAENGHHITNLDNSDSGGSVPHSSNKSTYIRNSLFNGNSNTPPFLNRSGIEEGRENEFVSTPSSSSPHSSSEHSTITTKFSNGAPSGERSSVKSDTRRKNMKQAHDIPEGHEESLLTSVLSYAARNKYDADSREDIGSGGLVTNNVSANGLRAIEQRTIYNNNRHSYPVMPPTNGISPKKDSSAKPENRGASSSTSSDQSERFSDYFEGVFSTNSNPRNLDRRSVPNERNSYNPKKHLDLSFDDNKKKNIAPIKPTHYSSGFTLKQHPQNEVKVPDPQNVNQNSRVPIVTKAHLITPTYESENSTQDPKKLPNPNKVNNANGNKTKPKIAAKPTKPERVYENTTKLFSSSQAANSSESNGIRNGQIKINHHASNGKNVFVLKHTDNEQEQRDKTRVADLVQKLNTKQSYLFREGNTGQEKTGANNNQNEKFRQRF